MKRNSIEISTRRIKLKLLFKNRVAIVADNSATGKTLLANTLVDYAKIHKEYSDISYFNSTTDESGKPLLEALKTMSDRFIIIDRADITLDSEARDYIFFDNKNQYLIFGRGLDELVCSCEQLAVLKTTIINNLPQIELDYPIGGVY